MGDTKVCVEPGCNRPAKARKRCTRHWQTWARRNRDQVVPQGSLTYMERFWAKVDKNGPIPERRPDLGPCWLWTGAVNKKTGYGNFGKPQKLPHRISYVVAVGPIPDGYEVDHLCKVRHCVNPKHLEAVTRSINQRRSDSPAGVAASRDSCVNGHPFDEANTGRRANRRPVLQAVCP